MWFLRLTVENYDGSVGRRYLAAFSHIGGFVSSVYTPAREDAICFYDKDSAKATQRLLENEECLELTLIKVKR